MAKVKGVAYYKKQADKYWSMYIRLRDSDTYGYGNCITCGTRKYWKEAQNGHFVSRTASVLRYDELNCNLQCVGCNMFKQGNLYEYGKQLDLKYGDGTADRLHSQRFDTKKWTVPELEKIISESKEYIKDHQK